MDSLGDVLSIEIARLTVAKLAIGEIEIFDEMAPNASSVRIEDQALGFGLTEMQALTPVVLQVVGPVIRYVAPKLFEVAMDISKDATKDIIRKEASWKNRFQFKHAGFAKPVHERTTKTRPR